MQFAKDSSCSPSKLKICLQTSRQLCQFSHNVVLPVEDAAPSLSYMHIPKLIPHAALVLRTSSVLQSYMSDGNKVQSELSADKSLSFTARRMSFCSSILLPAVALKVERSPDL